LATRDRNCYIGNVGVTYNVRSVTIIYNSDCQNIVYRLTNSFSQK